MKKFLLLIVVVISGLFLTTNVHAETTSCTVENISDGRCSITNELTIEANDEQTIGANVRVENGGKLTITGSGKVTLSDYIFVAGGGELIIDASDVEAQNIIAMVTGKLTVGPNANIVYSDENSSTWAIYANTGSDITLNGNITVTNANMFYISNGTLGTPSITVDGAKLTVDNGMSIFDFIAKSVKSNITIKDGELNGKVFAVHNDPSSSINDESEIVIESGKFSDPSTIKSEYIAEGSVLNEDGTVSKIELPVQPENKPTESTNSNVSSTTNIKEEANPNTSDSILTSVAIGIMGLISLVGCGIYYKRFQ